MLIANARRPSPHVITALLALAVAATGCDKSGVCDFHLAYASASSGAKAQEVDRCMPVDRSDLCGPGMLSAGSDVTARDFHFTKKGSCDRPAMMKCNALLGTFSECPKDGPAAKGAGDPPAAKELTLPKDAAPGAAYFKASYENGIVVLDAAGTWSSVPESRSTSVDGPFLASDGAAYFAVRRGEAATKDLFRLDGPKATKIASLPTDYAPCQTFDARDGKMIALCNEDAHVFDGKTWKKEHLPRLMLGNVVLDATGKAWSTSSSDIYAREADGWKKIDGPKDTKFQSGRRVGVSAKDLFDITTKGIARWTGTAFEPVGQRFGDGTSAKASSNGGLFAFSTLANTPAREALVVVMDQDGGQRSVPSSIAAPIVDRTGRVWGEDEGRLLVIDGASTTEYPMGSIPLLDDMSVDLEAAGFVVVNGGPKLPPVGEVRKATALKGTIVLGEKPAVNTPIEICPSPQLYGATPCTGNKLRFVTQTNERGEFEVPNVPVGVYGIGLHASSKWSVDIRGVGVTKAGEVKDLGTKKYDRW